MAIRLTDEQVLAAAATDRLVNIVSAPGSGKTTVAAERFGHLHRRNRQDLRGVLGLSFTRAAVREFSQRIERRWGSQATAFPNSVTTFDEMHVRLMHALLREGLIVWPGGHKSIEVVDDYAGWPGFRYLPIGNWRRLATVDESGLVISQGFRVTAPILGIGRVDKHRSILDAGVASHEDVRCIVRSALRIGERADFATGWIRSNFRDLVIDEIYDAAPLDLAVAHLAIRAGASLTVIGDPRQALYGWRGATPEKVQVLLDSAPEAFVNHHQSRSFRFKGSQMPKLSADLRAGHPVKVPPVLSGDVDAVLARRWGQLWDVGANVLPLAFRNAANGTDALINLFLDVVTRACLGVQSYGRQSALLRLGLDRDVFDERQEEVFRPWVDRLRSGSSAEEVLEGLRDASLELGVMRRPVRLRQSAEAERVLELERLQARLTEARFVPGLTVHQAKGREWDRVGVVLTERDERLLSNGLRELEDDDCVLYVALTRARWACGHVVRV